uniref:Vacuolar amino acid transporter 1 n=1 Tax=Rhizophora mucronata TaxID=61149 RepID=A0A2P2M7G4_RHIMU
MEKKEGLRMVRERLGLSLLSNGHRVTEKQLILTQYQHRHISGILSVCQVWPILAGKTLTWMEIFLYSLILKVTIRRKTWIGSPQHSRHLQKAHFSQESCPLPMDVASLRLSSIHLMQWLELGFSQLLIP